MKMFKWPPIWHGRGKLKHTSTWRPSLYLTQGIFASEGAFVGLSGPSFGLSLWLSTQALSEISKFHRLACPLRSHPSLTLCPWIPLSAGSLSMNSVCTTTVRAGVTSGTVHLRASNVNSIKGYIGSTASSGHTMVPPVGSTLN